MNTALAANKQHLTTLLEAIAGADGLEAEITLDKFCQPDCTWNFFHPLPRVRGNKEAADIFWSPLKRAFPDYEFRPVALLGGDYEGLEHVSMLGFAMGNFKNPWLGIPATKKLSMLRFGLNATIREGRLSRVHVMFDLIDLMHQAGFYPLKEMPGSAVQWPFAPASCGIGTGECNERESARSLEIIREMQAGLPAAGKVVDRASAAASHSPHWSDNMNWYGPAGIGSARGMEGFRDHHGALFLQAFPDRSGIRRQVEGPEERAGHFCEIGDGKFAITAGWPAMRGRHTGPNWLGLPSTGREIEMRVADWYRLDCEDRIADNWVMIDIPHVLAQMEVDILSELPFAIDPAKPRLS